jgi:pyruvate dehydrogenase E2 component (dihydrolipoamide acetyltransferase)
VKALPIVRKLARELGVDITTVRASGPDGRVTREDVLAASGPSDPGTVVSAAETPAPSVAPVVPESRPAGPPPSTGEDRRQPLSRLRRTIAANMAKSWAEIPHVTTFDDVDATRLLEVRRALGERHEMKIPLEALVIKAVLPALDEYPEFNASIDGDDIVLHESKDIGIAVDTPEGLMVAVIRDAAERSVMELAAEVRRLGEGARDRSLGLDEITGQTFTVSNIGAVGGGHGTPIVPYGTVAILSVGTAKPRPVVRGEELAVAPVMPLSLSYDHRVIDGAVGRRFMALVIENLEEPALFLAG